MVGGKRRENRLLTEGWWGRARHINYTLELICAWSWGGFAGTSAPLSYAYPVFLTILLLHRVIRDEQRCHAKYGDGYARYCAMVPYRLVPGLI